MARTEDLAADWHIRESVHDWLEDHVTFESPTHLVITVDEDQVRLSTATISMMTVLLATLDALHRQVCGGGWIDDDQNSIHVPPELPQRLRARPTTSTVATSTVCFDPDSTTSGEF